MQAINHQEATEQEPMTPEAFLEFFLLNFRKYCGKSEEGWLARMHNSALDHAWQRGHMKGYEDGYRAGVADAGMAEASATRVIDGLCHRV